MIQYKQGDLLKEKVEAIVNAVNCVGVMGKGLALQFKKRFPENYDAYKSACDDKKVVIGKMFIYETNTSTNPKFIINFPTKRHWAELSKLEDIESGLSDLIEVIKVNNIHSMALPRLGCGLGGLKWEEVQKTMDKYLKELKQLNIIIFNGTSRR